MRTLCQRGTKLGLKRLKFGKEFVLNIEIMNGLSNKIREMANSSPVGDFEHNIRALLQSTFTKLELVSREEFDVQAELLRVTRQSLDAMAIQLDQAEKVIASLELVLHKSNK